MHKDKFLSITTEDNYRLIAVSDIHGGVHLFRKLIEQVGLRDQDYLVIIGDSIERGPYSFEMLQYLKELVHRENTYILTGNHEWYILTLLLEERNSEELLEYVKGVKYPSIIQEWCRQKNIDYNSLEDSREFQKELQRLFKEDINFLNSLHLSLEFDDFLFIHSGVENMKNWKDSKLEVMLYGKSFRDEGHCLSKYLVVGHWPATNYRNHSLNGDVLIDDKKKIISIDGGYGVKTTGQLNALIIEKQEGNYRFSSEAVDDFKCLTVTMNQEITQQSTRKVTWFDSAVDLIDRQEEFSLCELKSTGEKLYIKNEFIKSSDKGYFCSDDYVTLFLNVKAGENIQIVDFYGSYAFAKYREEFGWIHQDYIKQS